MDSNKIKRGLGRGLSSLIGETKVTEKKNQLSISDLMSVCPSSHFHFFQFLQFYHIMSLMKVAWHVLWVKNM